ncbi:hypothetical protein NPIL_61231 [Nephila pilipes]|uniref:Uncharacterized protein n=1 Tax=Nephila pilipes TaxID=299642 RepID=A0A8X6TRA7_NEPPI|nr:hypothetical protein NPIL_61231 [Nephila pilipes]
MRMICNARWFVRNDDLRNVINLSTIQNYIQEMADKFDNLANNTNLILAEIENYSHITYNLNGPIGRPRIPLVPVNFNSIVTDCGYPRRFIYRTSDGKKRAVLPFTRECFLR